MEYSTGSSPDAMPGIFKTIHSEELICILQCIAYASYVANRCNFGLTSLMPVIGQSQRFKY